MYYKVYLILAHKNPKQINELITLLDDNKSFFFIHVDKNVEEKYFKTMIKNSNCYFVKNRVKCDWGSFNLVNATLNGIAEINSFMSKNYFDSSYHCILLSGEDLPIKKNVEIHSFLENNEDKSFINFWQLPYNNWWGGGFFRFESIYMFNYKKHQKLNSVLNFILRKLNMSFLMPISRLKQNFLDFKFYGNSQWMILNSDLIQSLLESSKESKKLKSILKYTLAPDELYFSNLFFNIKLFSKFNIVNFKTHLVKFNGFNSSPEYLNIDEIENNLNEPFLFARKFDEEKTPNVIAFIKHSLLK